MGERLKRKKKTEAVELPEEIIEEEILTRVPIKSAVRFKSVSKSWLSLFSHPPFVKKHYTRNASEYPNDYDCVIAKKHTKIVLLSRYEETFLFSLDSNMRIEPFLFPIRRNISILIGSVQGLVCLRRGKMLSLWNPAIHQYKEFTLPSPHVGYECDIGFGFDPVSNDYKVVVLSEDLRSASVYHSNSGSWTDIFVSDHVFHKNRGYHSDSPITIVNDCPYWTFSRYTSDSTVLSLIAVKFDARSNKFKLLPEFQFDTSVPGGSYEISHQFVDMNDCFTLIVYHPDSVDCIVDLYSFDGEEVWSKIYTSITPSDFYTRYMYVSVSQGFKYGGEIVFYDDESFFFYNHKTDTMKHLLGTASTHFSSISCFRYTPSLVYLEGMKSVYLTTQTRTPGLSSRTPRRLISSLRG